jgi:hypothetical protein
MRLAGVPSWKKKEDLLVCARKRIIVDLTKQIWQEMEPDG